MKAALLQTGSAQQDVYVIPPHESSDRDHYWLLLSVAYGLVNSNVKWQHQSDAILVELGLPQVTVMPELFYRMVDGKIAMVVAKIVDDLFVTGIDDSVTAFIKTFNSCFKLGTIASGPGRLHFYRMNIT